MMKIEEIQFEEESQSAKVFIEDLDFPIEISFAKVFDSFEGPHHIGWITCSKWDIDRITVKGIDVDLPNSVVDQIYRAME